MKRLHFALAVICLPLCGAAGQTLSVNFRGTTLLDSSASDQNGRQFTVTGLSGIDYVGGDLFLAVMDNSDKLVFIVVTLNANGSVAAAPIAGGLTLSESRDFEGIAFTTPERNSVFLSDLHYIVRIVPWVRIVDRSRPCGSKCRRRRLRCPSSPFASRRGRSHVWIPSA